MLLFTELKYTKNVPDSAFLRKYLYALDKKEWAVIAKNENCSAMVITTHFGKGYFSKSINFKYLQTYNIIFVNYTFKISELQFESIECTAVLSMMIEFPSILVLFLPQF